MAEAPVRQPSAQQVAHGQADAEQQQGEVGVLLAEAGDVAQQRADVGEHAEQRHRGQAADEQRMQHRTPQDAVPGAGGIGLRLRRGR
ncbi:hypothetical protein FQZ97_1094320 [compost metagenome]